MRAVSTIALALGTALMCSTASAVPALFSSIGTVPADIQGSVNDFRIALGTLNPNVAGSFGSGRREINWDGVPDSFSTPNALPANFFNVNSPRGVVFSTPGTGFAVSADSSNPTSTPVRFGDIYTGGGGGAVNFQTFSPERLFTALGSTITDVNFFVPGSNTAARTRGFGVVFTDTDDGANSNSGIEFFDANDLSLGSFLAPSNTTNQNLAFIGVDFGTAVVRRVRITSGRCVLPNADCGVDDVVVMDDFIYGEPVAAADAVPVPASALLLGAALAGLGIARRRG